MKIIHTSDWHLGQFFMGKSRQKEHQSFLNWLIVQANEKQIDALIVAGDIFDTGAPPSYARELYHKFVINFCTSTENTVPLIFVAGNHDSVAMLDETSELLKHFNTHVISYANEATHDKQILPITGQDGEEIGLICAVPFLRSRDLVSSIAGASGKDKQRDMQTAIEAHYQQVYEKAVGIRDRLKKSVPIVMTGHLTVVGAKTSESVRDIYIGSLDAFSAASFPPADYIALGHIHKHQKINCDHEVYYCGSPIPLSFDELNQTKSVQLVDLQDSSINVLRLEIPVFQAMHKIKGNLGDIGLAIEMLKSRYSKSTIQAEESIWVEVEIEEQDYLEDLQRRVEEMIKGSSIEVLCLKRARNKRNLSLSVEQTERLQELTPEEVFEKRMILEGDVLDDDLQARLKHKFKEVISQLAHEGER